jgi:3-oxoacyl-[acyl-carrier-protein] synthase-1
MMGKTCGIARMTRFPRGLYQTDFCAEIPAEVESAIRAREDSEIDSRTFLLAKAVGRGVVRQFADSSPGRNISEAGLVLATTKADMDEFEHLLSNPGGKVSGRSNPGVLAHHLAGELGLTGPVMAVSNACASGSIAIIQSIRLIQRGDADIMVVAGVDVLTDFILSGFSCLAALSSGPCRPYGRSRDGLSLGEGAGALILARDLPGVTALATVRGWGVSNDANHITGPSPTGEGLKLALSRTLNMAEMQPHEIDFINGHGTGTVYNDEMEAQAFAAIFEDCLPPVASMKGYFGHTLGAAGVMETILCVMALREQTIPACLGFDSLGVSKPLSVPVEHLCGEDLTNVITVKCGFSGVNATLALSGPNGT